MFCLRGKVHNSGRLIQLVAQIFSRVEQHKRQSFVEGPVESKKAFLKCDATHTNLYLSVLLTQYFLVQKLKVSKV